MQRLPRAGIWNLRGGPEEVVAASGRCLGVCVSLELTHALRERCRGYADTPDEAVSVRHRHLLGSPQTPDLNCKGSLYSSPLAPRSWPPTAPGDPSALGLRPVVRGLAAARSVPFFSPPPASRPLIATFWARQGREGLRGSDETVRTRGGV